MATSKKLAPKDKGDAIRSMLGEKNRLSKQLAQAAVSKAMSGKNVKSLKIKVKFGSGDNKPKHRKVNHKAKWGY